MRLAVLGLVLVRRRFLALHELFDVALRAVHVAQAGTRLVALLTLENALRCDHAFRCRPQVARVSARGTLHHVILMSMRVLRARRRGLLILAQRLVRRMLVD